MAQERAPRPCYIENETKFNKLMQKQRQKLRMSFGRLEKACGVSKSYLAVLEKGQFEPSVEIGIAICQALDIDIEEFIAYIYEKKMTSLTDEIVKECQEWGIEAPEFVKKETSEFIERLVTQAYRAGLEQGKKEAAREYKEKLLRVLEDENSLD